MGGFVTPFTHQTSTIHPSFDLDFGFEPMKGRGERPVRAWVENASQGKKATATNERGMP